jgi:hypothetical protein
MIRSVLTRCSAAAGRKGGRVGLGTGGAVSVRPSAATHLVLDVYGYCTDSPSSGRAAGRKAFEVEIRLPTREEVGDDAGGAASHRPSHVAVTDVEEQIAVAAVSEDRWAVTRPGPSRRRRETCRGQSA